MSPQQMAPVSAPASSRWCALFLSAESPGQVLRFLERRREKPPEDLLLSDAVGPQSVRTLLASSGGDAQRWMGESGAAFLRAFGQSVTLVFAYNSEWGWRVWNPGTGEEPETFSETVQTPSFAGRIKRRALGQPPDTAWERARVWAAGRGLPVDRVPAWARRPLPIVDYATVAQLDQRSLLVENEPRLYRFSFGTSEEDSTI